MKDFDLRKYLAENKLLKEDISSHKEEAKYFLEKFIDDNGDTFEFIPDLKTGYIDTKDNSYNVDELASIFLDIGQDIPRGKYNKKYKGKGGTYVVVAEGKILKENVDFPELEDEFEGAMDAMVVEPKVYLQDIIDASAEEIVSDDYYEIMNAVEMGTYSAEEAVKLAKAWAKEKLSNLAEGRIHEVFGMFNKKEKLYVPKGINQIHNYVNDRQVKDIEAKIKSKEISPKQLSGINSVMMAIEEFLKAKLGIIENEKNGIKFLIYPTGKAGGLTDSKLDLYINLPQKGKPNNLRTNPEETLKMMKVFIDDYLKKQEGIDVASAKVKKSNDTTAYDVTVPISFKELKEK